MIYTLTTIYVIKKANFQLDLNAYLTIGFFYFCLTILFLAYLIKVLIPQINDLSVQIAVILSQYGLYLVFTYFTLQMKIVFTKIRCENYREYDEAIKRSTIVLVVFILALTASFVLEVTEKVLVTNP